MEPIKPASRGHVVLYLILLIVIVGLFYSLRKCNRSYLSDELRPSGGDTLDVAIEYLPISFYTIEDTLGGFNYDLMRMIAERHGLKLKFHPVVTLSKALQYIENDTYDILAADIPLTAEFKERYAFLEPVLLDKQVLVQLRDSSGNARVNNQLDLAGDTVWIVDGSSIESRIINLGHEIGDTIYVEHEKLYGPEQLFLMTALGEIKQAVINERVAEAMAKDYPDVDISTDISFTQFQSWIVSNKRPEMRDSIDKWIKEIKLTPEYKELENRYLK